MSSETLKNPHFVRYVMLCVITNKCNYTCKKWVLNFLERGGGGSPSTHAWLRQCHGCPSGSARMAEPSWEVGVVKTEDNCIQLCGDSICVYGV